MENAILQLEKVSKSYRSAAGDLPILRDVNLELSAGESLGIIGPSGSGKSTLLNIIGTLDRATGGRVLIDGEDVTALDETALAEVRNRKLGFIFQEHHLLPQCTILENVLVPTLASNDRNARSDAVERAKKLIDRVGLAARRDHRPAELSGGERQRVAVVRALINQPKLVLADEPTGALDRTSAANLARLLIELNQEQQVTLIVVTHALDLAGMMKQVKVIEDYGLKDGSASVSRP